MKNLIVLVLTLASAFVLTSKELKSRNLVVPAGRPEGRITRGHDATEGQFPYQVGLFTKRTDLNFTRCGGSLLNNEWVLTAAHCTRDLIEVQVILGTTNLKNAAIIHVVPKTKVIKHKHYNSLTEENDIALIQIPYTEYTDNIQPVKLPALGQVYSEYADDIVIATGWGITSDGSLYASDILQWARLFTISNTACQSFYQYNIFPSSICTATPDGVNICSGDSGGPIVLESSKTLIGLTSWGFPFCIDYIPSVFTLITSYLDWIMDFTGVSYQV